MIHGLVISLDLIYCIYIDYWLIGTVKPKQEEKYMRVFRDCEECVKEMDRELMQSGLSVEVKHYQNQQQRL